MKILKIIIYIIIFLIIYYFLFKNSDSTEHINSKDEKSEIIENAKNNAIFNANKYKSSLDSFFRNTYIKSMGPTNWEKLSISHLKDDIYKVNFAFISTDKTKECTLYSKGIFTQKISEDSKIIFFLRPNLAKDVMILIQPKDSNSIKLKIENQDKFNELCGKFHDNINGEYILMH